MPDGFDKRTGKIIPLDYETLSLASEEREPICLSHREREIIVSQLGYARWRSRWMSGEYTVTDQEWTTAQEWTDNLIARLLRDTECVGNQCSDHSPLSSVFTYEPTNPHTEPDVIPDGYVLPPWRIVDGSNPADVLLALQPGDLMASSPPIADGFNFPRFRVSFENVTEIELHLLSYPTGGLAIITIDSDPLTVEVIDLTRDLNSLPFETEPVVIVERKFYDDAAHYIDVTFSPSIANQFPPVLFGGGLRKAVICHPALNGGEECNVDVRQNTEEPCKLEKTDDGTTWSEFADITLCLKGSIATTPSGGLEIITDGVATPIGQSPPDADPRERERTPRNLTGDEIKCLAAANASNVMWRLVEEGIAEVKKYTSLSLLLVLSLVLSVVFGAAWGILAIPAASAAAAFVVLASLSTGSFTAKEFREFACILQTNCTVTDGVAYFDFAAVKAAVVAKQPSWSFNVWNAVYAFLDVIGESGLNLAADTTAITDTCCDFCSTGTNSTYLYLTAEPYSGVLVSKNANNTNTIYKNAGGLGVQGNGSTLYARWDWSFIVPPGCEVTDLGVYMPTYREPISVSLFLNQLTTAYKTYSNYRPFGNHHYNGALTLRPGTNTLTVLMFCNAYTNAEAQVERIYAVYKGCDPFEYYR